MPICIGFAGSTLHGLRNPRKVAYDLHDGHTYFEQHGRINHDKRMQNGAWLSHKRHSC